MAKRKIPKTQAKKLLSKGESDLLKGFTSRAGKPFDARLKLEDNEVKFSF
jgi:DNA topoisomerase-3